MFFVHVIIPSSADGMITFKVCVAPIALNLALRDDHERLRQPSVAGQSL